MRERTRRPRTIGKVAAPKKTSPAPTTIYGYGDKPTAVSYRTSQIIDPPDGRMPAFTPEAQERMRKQRDYLVALLQGTSGGKPGPISPLRNQPPPDYNLDRMNRADGPEDRSSDERCFLNELPSTVAA